MRQDVHPITQQAIRDIFRIAISDPMKRLVMQGRRRRPRRFVPLAAQLEHRRARAKRSP